MSVVEDLFLLILELGSVPAEKNARERSIYRDEKVWEKMMQSLRTWDQLRSIVHDREGVDQVPQSVRNGAF